MVPRQTREYLSIKVAIEAIVEINLQANLGINSELGLRNQALVLVVTLLFLPCPLALRGWITP